MVKKGERWIGEEERKIIRQIRSNKKNNGNLNWNEKMWEK